MIVDAARDLCSFLRPGVPLHGDLVVPGATHLFEEPGALAQVASVAVDWFLAHSALPQPRPAAERAPIQQNGRR